MHAVLQYAARFHCLVKDWKDCEEHKPQPKDKWNFVDQKREETKHRTEWFATANKQHKTEIFANNVGKWGKQHVEGRDMVRRMHGPGEVLVLVQKMLGMCETENGTKTEELLQAGAKWAHKSTARCQNEFRFSNTAGSVPRRQGKLMDIKEGLQEKNTEGCGMSSKREGFVAQKDLWNVARKRMLPDRTKEERDFVREYKATHEKQTYAVG